MIRSYCPSQYISATDVGTTELDMAVFAHEIGDMQACTGKPAELGGIPHELGSTGYGVSVAFKASLELLKGSKPISFNNNISISHNKNGYEKELRVTIQGFGSVGSFTAKFLDELVAGIKIVGISDVSGFIYNKDGLNIPRLMLDMRGKAKLSDPPKSEKVDNKIIPDSHSSYNILDKDDIFEVDSDVFIPVAMSGVINDKTAPKLLEHGIKIIVEAASIPTTPTADEYLNKNGVWIIPDFLANAGGVIGSFVEYQGRTEKEAFELIDYKIAKNVKQILSDAMVQTDESIYDETQNLRKIATEKAKRKVYRAMLLRKGAINVAREAYDRKGRMVPTN